MQIGRFTFAIIGLALLLPTAPIGAQDRPEGAASASQPASKPETVNGDSTKLEPIGHPMPYPSEARAKGIQGKVVVRVSISETGTVQNAEAVSGDPILTAAAIESIKSWKFKPFIKNGKPIEVSSNLPLTFALPPTVLAETKPDEGSANTSAERLQLPAGATTGHIVHRVEPEYPPIAHAAHRQGFVQLHAIITKDGKIADLKLISGEKEFAAAAIEAVRQWRYRPYLVDGKPVEVDTTIEIRFTLAQPLGVDRTH